MKIFAIILCLWFLVKDSNSENIVRLVNGKTQDEGFIQIRYNDTWGTLLDYRNSEPLMNAFVVCRMLNYTKAIKGDAVWYNPYAANSTYWPRVLRCTGREETIRDCYTAIPINMDGPVKDPPYSAVYAVCGSLSKVDKKLQVRLVDTILKNVGIVETTYAWPWQKICIAYNWVSGIQWSSKDANVVCKMLGYRRAIGGFIYKISMRADSSKSLVHNVVSKQYHCTGKEATIAECAQVDRKYCSKSYLDRNYFVGAFCENNEIPPSVEFRISGYKEPNIGFLEVKHRGVWATVCTTFSELNRTATDFICHQLGYLGSDELYFSGNRPKILISWELNKSCAISKRGNCSHGDTWKVYHPGPCEYPKKIACKVAAVPRYHIIEGCRPRLVINRTGLTLKEKQLITYYQVIVWQHFGPELSSFYISGNTTLLNIGDNKTYVKNVNRPFKIGKHYGVQLRAVYEDEDGSLGYGHMLNDFTYNLPSFKAIICPTTQGPTTNIQSTTPNEKASDIAPESSHQPLRTGEIVGIVIGVLLVIAIVGIVIFVYKNRKVPQGAENMKLNPVPENPEL
ncbi:neurotrypsin isoform X2 [Exaiptasia diaphana]|uniref:SRCR domain-containing protein n=1 Tax=Exaiptasia diaphana TaxID=2652724 RepID=A0A913YED2_EXADI|nr:neurotrypsin isoform X2 [Exaiptasia diaphana]